MRTPCRLLPRRPIREGALTFGKRRLSGASEGGSQCIVSSAVRGLMGWEWARVQMGVMAAADDDAPCEWAIVGEEGRRSN